MVIALVAYAWLIHDLPVIEFSKENKLTSESVFLINIDLIKKKYLIGLMLANLNIIRLIYK